MLLYIYILASTIHYSQIDGTSDNYGFRYFSYVKTDSVPDNEKFWLHIENGERDRKTNSLIKDGDFWYYYDSIMPENEPWFFGTNSDIRWKKGRSILGYGNGNERTVIQFGNNSNNKYTTSYFKKIIDLVSPKSHIAYLVDLNVDDGAIIYLNGKEIHRINMPDTVIEMETFASSRIQGNFENKHHLFVLDPDLFVTGENIFAVSVHQYDKQSSDCSFWIEVSASNNVALIYDFMQQQFDTKLDNRVISLNLQNQEYIAQLANKEAELSKICRNGIIAIIGLFSIIISTLIYILRRENKHMKRNSLRYKEELNEKQEELMNIGLLHLKKDRLLDELGGTVKDMIEKKENQGQVLQLLRKKISHYMIQNKDMEALKLHFENVHSDYFIRLKQDFPALTTNDLRLCGYIRLQLTTKEIAELLSINHRSVQTIKYRLKKKLEIHKHVDLVTFLSKYF